MKRFSHPTLFSIFFFASAAIASAAEEQSSLWAMIQQGGWAMIPLALCSLTLIYLIIHSLRETRNQNFGNDTIAAKVSELCQGGDLQKALSVAKSDVTALGRALSKAIPKIEKHLPENRHEIFDNEIAESLELEENAIAQWIHYLSVIANVAPMIGLLGTVSGMIGGFQTMSAGGMGRPELFAGDIGEALITTATGLCIGIPAMIAHSYFSNKLNTLIVETSRRAGLVADALLHNK